VPEPTGLPASAIAKLPDWARQGARGLGLLPTPRRVVYSGGLVPLHDVAVLLPGPEAERQVAERLRAHLRACGLPRVPAVATPEAAERYSAVVAVGDATNDARVAALWQEAGGIPVAWDRLKPGGYALASRCHGRRGRVVLAARTGEGLGNALASFRQLTVRVSAGVSLKQAVLVDEPAFAWRGVIEGFYGPPWSHQQRLRLLRFMGQHKLNLFIYAPKDDPFHRERWRDLYPARQGRELKQLVEAARDSGVRFCYALHPGGTTLAQSVRYSSAEDLALLCAKLDSLRALGVGAFGLLMDDIVDVEHLEGGAINQGLYHDEDKRAFPTLAAGQVHLVNAVHAHLEQAGGDLALFFCPTEYKGLGGSDYLRELGAGLAPGIQVFWTGREICTPRFTAADADAFAACIGRPPFIWDNYPVNDYDRDRLLLGPVKNRAANLAGHVNGLVANPMNEGEASMLPLATVADYLWHPEGYDPEAAWEMALLHLGQAQGYAALRRFARQNMSSFLDRAESPELAAAICAFWEDYRARGKQADGSALQRIFRSFCRLPVELERRVDNQFLLADIGGYLQKLRQLGAVGMACLQTLLDPSPGRQVRLERLVQEMAANGRRVCDGVMQPFIEKALHSIRKGG